MMHPIHQLYSEKFDLSEYGETPKKIYMVASIPRSGSTYFLLKLWQTGCLGAPMEYANFPILENIMKRLDQNCDPVVFWKKIKRFRTTSNGVYGFKMFMANYINFANNHPELLKDVSPDKVILFTRKDEISQAISLSRAIKSSAWFSGAEERVAPEYDYDHIKRQMLSIKSQKKFWEDALLLGGGDIFRTTYEELIEDENYVLSEICKFIGVNKNPAKAINLPMIEIQRDDKSRLWRERFLEDMKNDNDMDLYRQS